MQKIAHCANFLHSKFCVIHPPIDTVFWSLYINARRLMPSIKAVRGSVSFLLFQHFHNDAFFDAFNFL